MKETKTTDSTARQKYEPMEIKVMTVTPQGVLCGSGGVSGASGMTHAKLINGGSL